MGGMRPTLAACLGLTLLACGTDATPTPGGGEDTSTTGDTDPGGETTEPDTEGGTGGESSSSGDPGSTGTGSSGGTSGSSESTAGESESSTGTSSGSSTSTTSDVTSSTSQGDDSVCGDGIVEGGEACDDGNAIDADGCNNDCQESGTTVWEDNSIGAMDAVGDWLWALAVDSEGNIVATGRRPTATEDWNVWLVKFDPDGTLLWEEDIDAYGGTDEGSGIATDSNDNIIVTGYLEGNAGSPLEGYFLHKYDPDGTLLWEDAPAPGPTAGTWGMDVAVGTSDEIYAVGTRDEGTFDGYSIWLRAYDSDGTIRWTEQVSQAVEDTDNRAAAVALGSMGEVYVGGHEGVTNSNTVAWLSKYDEDGNADWTVTRDGGAAGIDAYYGLAVAADGDVVAVGRGSVPGQGFDILFDRYDTDGNEVWTTTLGGGRRRARRDRRAACASSPSRRAAVARRRRRSSAAHSRGTVCRRARTSPSRGRRSARSSGSHPGLHPTTCRGAPRAVRCRGATAASPPQRRASRLRTAMLASNPRRTLVEPSSGVRLDELLDRAHEDLRRVLLAEVADAGERPPAGASGQSATEVGDGDGRAGWPGRPCPPRRIAGFEPPAHGTPSSSGEHIVDDAALVARRSGTRRLRSRCPSPGTAAA